VTDTMPDAAGTTVVSGYKIYGPYGSRRKMVALVSPGHRTTMSYARHLMSVSIGRELTADEEVDHIDDDCTNDVIGNLQILTPAQNKAKQDRLRREKSLVTLTCPQCKEDFTRPRRYTKLRSGSPGGESCCSRSCSASYHNRRRGKAS
jgi:hypothetical protein